MRVAALYDIHGNAPALEAALADVVRPAPDRVVVGGDVLSGPLPRETAALLLDVYLPLRDVPGNADRELVDGAGDAWVVEQLDAAEREEHRRP